MFIIYIHKIYRNSKLFARFAHMNGPWKTLLSSALANCEILIEYLLFVMKQSNCFITSLIIIVLY